MYSGVFCDEFPLPSSRLAGIVSLREGKNTEIMKRCTGRRAEDVAWGMREGVTVNISAFLSRGNWNQFKTLMLSTEELTNSGLLKMEIKLRVISLGINFERFH